MRASSYGADLAASRGSRLLLLCPLLLGLGYLRVYTFNLSSDGARLAIQHTLIGGGEGPKATDQEDLLSMRWKDVHADQLACDFPYQKVDQLCPRFVHLPIVPGAGLGHKYFTYILGVLLAIDMKATYLYMGEQFRTENNAMHEVYTWVEDMLQLDYREINHKEAIDRYNPKVVHLRNEVGQESCMHRV